MRRLLSAPAVHFKGTGWYVTDYAGKKNGSNGADPSKAEKKTAGKDNGKKVEPKAKEKAAGKDGKAAASKSA
jgi:hypothetical protein